MSGAELAAAKPECEHYWAFHCFGGLSVRLCQTCHEPDWDDVREQQEQAAATERSRVFVAIRHGIPLDKPWRGEALDLIFDAIQPREQP